MSTLKAKPFLKWAGGKTQLLPKIKELMPEEVLNNNVKYYVEPFVGSGAVLFDFMQSEKYEFEKAYIWDVNPELINAYKVIKEKNTIYKLIDKLNEKEDEYNKDEDKERRKKFYRYIKDTFNNELYKFEIELKKYEKEQNFDFLTERASQFIFLNRTCFNGLYRVNKSGKFNVPMGSYKLPKICDKENLLAVHGVLQKVEINCGDYKKSMEIIKELNKLNHKVFVYFDPPYRPLNTSSSFTSYSKFDFNDKNQRELSNFFKELDEIDGAYLMLSNSDPKNVNEDDKFFDDLYFKEGPEGKNLFSIHRVFARRNINSKANKRGYISELLITNYESKQNEDNED